MPGQMTSVLRFLRHAAGANEVGDQSDAALLREFVSQKSEDAFAAILQRHGPLVLAVCRRSLRDNTDAEDAFQATFLILAQKANAIGKRESVSSWLYKVAYRVALRARAKAPSRPLPAEPLQDPSISECWICSGRRRGPCLTKR